MRIVLQYSLANNGPRFPKGGKQLLQKLLTYLRLRFSCEEKINKQERKEISNFEQHKNFMVF